MTKCYDCGVGHYRHYKPEGGKIVQRCTNCKHIIIDITPRSEKRHDRERAANDSGIFEAYREAFFGKPEDWQDVEGPEVVMNSKTYQKYKEDLANEYQDHSFDALRYGLRSEFIKAEQARREKQHWYRTFDPRRFKWNEINENE